MVECSTVWDENLSQVFRPGTRGFPSQTSTFVSWLFQVPPQQATTKKAFCNPVPDLYGHIGLMTEVLGSRNQPQTCFRWDVGTQNAVLWVLQETPPESAATNCSNRLAHVHQGTTPWPPLLSWTTFPWTHVGPLAFQKTSPCADFSSVGPKWEVGMSIFLFWGIKLPTLEPISKNQVKRTGDLGGVSSAVALRAETANACKRSHLALMRLNLQA